MEMFEGKEGPRIFGNKEHAEFVAERIAAGENKTPRIVEVRVVDGQKASENGASFHRNLSIASRPPEEDLQGWIVADDPINLEKYGLEEL